MKSFLPSLKIKEKIFLMVGFFTFVLVATLILNYVRVDRIQKVIQNTAEHDLTLISHVSEITKLQLEQAISFQRAVRFGKFMIVNEDAKNSFIEAQGRFTDLSEDVGVLIKVCRDFTKEKGFVAIEDRISGIAQTHNTYTDLASGVFTLLLAGNYAEAEAMAQKIETLEDHLNSDLRAFLQQIVDNAQSTTANIRDHEKKLQVAVLISSVIGILVCVVFGVVISRRIIVPLEESAVIAHKISAGGRDISFPLSGDDEVGELLLAMNKMLVSIRQNENALIKINAELENRVRERTVEISDKNVLLDQSNKELTNLNQLKNNFLGMAAHDLRNPIAVIVGYTDLMLTELTGTLAPKQIEIMTKVRKRCMNMLDLINDYLDLSVIESGNLKLSINRVEDLNLLLKDCEESNALIAKTKSIGLDLKLDANLPAVYIDRERITQVMGNLISNAIKFSHPNTVVTVSAANDNQGVRVSVSDQGQGIPKDEQSKLFGEYSRTSVKSTAGEKSTGLGLAIVKKIIEAHGSTIQVKSEPGIGTTFSFTLPINKSA